MTAPPSVHLGHIGYDPLEEEFTADRAAESPPALADVARADQLPSVGSELRLPRAVEVGLRAQGIDPETMRAGEMVRGMLSMFGYRIAPGVDDFSHIAEKGGARTLIREVPHARGEYPELDESVIRKFVADFMSAGVDRGMLVSDKYAPFEIYERERREPRTRFVTRERLQNFVDAIALE
jgi:hypothetical protein